MSIRPIQVGDFVHITNVEIETDFNKIYIIREIQPGNIYISTEKEPTQRSLLFQSDNIWKVWGTNIPYKITFVTNSLSSQQQDVEIPLEIWKEIALFLPTAKKVLDFCKNSNKIEICRDVDFWNKWEKYHPPHPEFIYKKEFDDRYLVFFRIGDIPEYAGFYELEYNEEKKDWDIKHPTVIRNVTEDELDTIISKDPIKIIDPLPPRGDLTFIIRGNPKTGIKSITLRYFIEKINSFYTSIFRPGKIHNNRFWGMKKNGEILWVE